MGSIGVPWVVAGFFPLLALSGCFGSDDSTTSEGDDLMAPAPPAEFGADTGGIEGLVTDVEFVPLPGAQVGIPSISVFAATDADGRFSLSHIQPGTYEIFASKLGYDASGLHVTVARGEVVPLEFRLEPVALEVPHTVSMIQSGLFGCGSSWRPAVVFSGIAICGIFGIVDEEAGTDNFGELDKFLIEWELTEPTKDWKSLVVEMSWEPNQALGKGLTMIWEISGCSNVAEFRFARESGHSPLRAYVDAEDIEDILEATLDEDSREDCDPVEEPGSYYAAQNCNEVRCLLQSRVFSSPDAFGEGSPADLGVTWQQPFDQYLTAHYNVAAEEDYTALPDS